MELHSNFPIPLFTSAVGSSNFFVTCYSSKRVDDAWDQPGAGPAVEGSDAHSFASPSFPPFPLCGENLDRELCPNQLPTSFSPPIPVSSPPPPNLDLCRRRLDAGAGGRERLDTAGRGRTRPDAVAAIDAGAGSGSGWTRWRPLTREPAAGATGRGSGGSKEGTDEWRPRHLCTSTEEDVVLGDRRRRWRIEELDDGGLGAARELVHGVPPVSSSMEDAV
jgi:hypothetical protein